MNTIKITTAADKKYFYALLNLLGSLRLTQVNYSVVVYDLGLTSKQVNLLNEIKEVTSVKQIESKNKIFIQPYCAKCYIWKEMSFSKGQQIFLDAGLLIGNDLSTLIEQVKFHHIQAIPGSFTTNYCTPIHFIEKYDLPPDFMLKAETGAGFVVFNFDSEVTLNIVEHIYQMTLDGDCGGWSETEVHRSVGIMANDTVRSDCFLFRHDSTVLAVSIYKYLSDYMPLKGMEYFNHSYKMEYNLQTVYTFRRKDRIPTLGYLLKGYSFVTKLKFFRVYIRNILSYGYLTIKRNLRFFKKSKLCHYIVDNYRSSTAPAVFINSLDNKYQFQELKLNTIYNKPEDKRKYKLDTYKCLYSSPVFSEQVGVQQLVLDINDNCSSLYLIQISAITTEILNLLKQRNVDFFIRFKVLDISPDYVKFNQLLNEFKVSYDIYDQDMSDIFDKYMTDSRCILNPDEINFHPSFHNEEIIELFFKRR
tara:strand:- start:9023 stop:10447 length:1425 start_codon:yes stop_codon:yes gene_type:complete